ncbi:hypothetical protein M3J09_010382 [Ascochyta lentis]
MATMTIKETVTDSPTAYIPADIASPLANGRDGTPPLAILTLVAVIICGLILLFALGYFVILRCRGKCPHCPCYEDEVKKWRRGELKQVTPGMVQRRMRAWDLEKGSGELEAQEKVVQDRGQSLAFLEGRVEKSVQGEGKEDSRTGAEIEKPQPVHLSDLRHDSGYHVAAARRYSGGSEKTQVAAVDTGHPATYSAYLRDVVAPRDAETKRSLQEAEDQAFARLADRIQNPNNRDSVLQQATDELKQRIAAREEKEKEEQKEQGLKDAMQRMPPPRKGSQSRFVERFSLETNHDLQIGD